MKHPMQNLKIFRGDLKVKVKQCQNNILNYEDDLGRANFTSNDPRENMLFSDCTQPFWITFVDCWIQCLVHKSNGDSF